MISRILLSLVPLVFSAVAKAGDGAPPAAPGDEAGQAPARLLPMTTALLEEPLDLEIETGVEWVRGRAGFYIWAYPFFSRLDFPVSGGHVFLKASWAPLPEEKRVFLFLEGACRPFLSGTTKDTDWYFEYKWLHSRSETDGRSFRLRGGAGWKLPLHEDLRAEVRVGGFFGRDYFRMSNLRQSNFIPYLTSPPGEPFVTVHGPVATYDLHTVAWTLGLRLELRVQPWARLRLFGSTFPYACVRGFGNWKLRRYKFEQTGASWFLGHELGLMLLFDLAPGLALTLGLTRLDWGAMRAKEDGTFELEPEYNYRGADIVDWMRHLQYGVVFGVSASL